jgi:DNA-directed RNA polymerase specialized sigma24 family protein
LFHYLMGPELPPEGSVMVSERPFNSEVTPHRVAAFNLACWPLQDREEAQDVVQDAVSARISGVSWVRGKERKNLASRDRA